ncbi:hypothetical protein Goari_024704, partial [Gossypium aridum]|nr:hypothetical protein [Gossypium aridum]
WRPRVLVGNPKWSTCPACQRSAQRTQSPKTCIETIGKKQREKIAWSSALLEHRTPKGPEKRHFKLPEASLKTPPRPDGPGTQVTKERTDPPACFFNRFMAFQGIDPEHGSHFTKEQSLQTLPVLIWVAQLDPMLFLVVSEIIDIIDETCQKLKHPQPCLQAFLNNLPGSDFNAIFKHLLRCFYERVEIEKGKNKCFVTGVAGSFYGRLFPPNSLQFVHSSYAIMWIS